MFTIDVVSLVQVVFLTLMLYGVIILFDQARFRGLSYLLLLVSILLIFNLLEDNNITRDIYLVTPIFSLLCGPFFYWFVYRFLVPTVELKLHHGLHLLPAAVALPFTYWPQWVLFAGTISQLFYLMACLRLIKRYHKTVDERSSCSYSYRLDWLRRLLVAVVIIDVIDLTRLNLQPFLPYPWGSHWYLVMQLVFLILYSTLIAYSVRRPELFDGIFEDDLKRSNSALESQNKKLLDKQQARTIFKQLDTVINDQSLYLKPRLTLRALATEIGMSEKDISWAINCGADKSFNDYINGLRIEVFKRRLSEISPHKTLLDLALDCGFNSKSTFNSVFKQQVGLTPSQYLKSMA